MNAGKADSLTIADTGSTEQAVYFSEGVPKVCTNLKGIPSGGTVGQYLIKNSGTNFDVSWSSLDLSPYLTVADASGIYLSKASASTIYETKDNASNYLNKNGDTMLGTLDMNDQIITGLKEPVNNTDATSKQYVDTNVLKTLKYASPVNLLDNSDFRYPVAQAGIGGNHGTQAYAADRWILTSGSVSHQAGVGLTLNGTITQKLEHSPTGTVCAFVGRASGQASISYSAGAVTITSSGGVIAWAALYQGTYTEETLPAYRPKGHAAELAECMRYYQINFVNYEALNANTVPPGVTYPIMMRIAPTVTIYDEQENAGYVSLWGQAGIWKVSSVPGTNLRIYYLNLESFPTTDTVVYYKAVSCADL